MKLSQLRGQSPTQIAQSLGTHLHNPEALERFAALPWPDKRSEAYRYADLDRVWERDLEWVRTQSAPPRTTRALVVTDGIVTEVPENVTVQTIDPVTVDPEHHDPLYYLSHALSPRVIEVTIASDVHLRIEHHIHAHGALAAYRIVLRVAEKTQASLSERLVDMSLGQPDRDGTVLLYGYDVHIARDASLTWVGERTSTCEGAVVIASHAFKVASQGRLWFGQYDFGSGQGVHQLRFVLDAYARVDLAHLLYATANARIGTVSTVVHRGAHSHSTQVAKNILGDTARGIFDALIRVEPSARYTVAHQNNRAILLDDGAYMAAKPQLEIDIDELEASHGSTTGQLDAQQLFYLRSRGIDEQTARKILILAFANEVIDTIADANTREQIHARFEQAYYGEAHLACLETCHGCEGTSN
jgi:Fe-S cluster assembly protein SufD